MAYPKVRSLHVRREYTEPGPLQATNPLRAVAGSCACMRCDFHLTQATLHGARDRLPRRRYSMVIDVHAQCFIESRRLIVGEPCLDHAHNSITKDPRHTASAQVGAKKGLSRELGRSHGSSIRKQVEC